MFRSPGGGNDSVDRPAVPRPTVEVRRHNRTGSTKSDASGSRLLGDGSGGGRGGKREGANIVEPGRARQAAGDDGDDGMWSDMAGMEMLQHPKRDGGHRRGHGHARTASTGSVGGLGGVGSAGMKGQEPAVKNCGCMTTSTFMKLVRT